MIFLSAFEVLHQAKSTVGTRIKCPPSASQLPAPCRYARRDQINSGWSLRQRLTTTDIHNLYYGHPAVTLTVICMIHIWTPAPPPTVVLASIYDVPVTHEGLIYSPITTIHLQLCHSIYTRYTHSEKRIPLYRPYLKKYILNSVSF